MFSWYSCGAASAIATKLALQDFPRVRVVYCEVKDEHYDNKRFLKDCQGWYAQPIEIHGRDDLGRCIEGAFKKAKFMTGVGGAPCTRMLKKEIRERLQKPGDTHIFGYTSDRDDMARWDRLLDANADEDFRAPLIERGLTHSDCLAMMERANIELPVMYKLGYKHNNCIGCVKATGAGYWQKIKVDFPKQWKERNEQEKRYGASIVKFDMVTVRKRWPEIYEDLESPEVIGPNGEKRYWRPRLDEIPDDVKPLDDSPDIQCSMFCLMAEGEYE